MILTKTPYRVSLFGGGTDYPEWFNKNGGACLGLAIDRHCYVGVKRMPPGQDFRYRVQYSKVDDCMNWAEIKHPAVRGVLKYLGVDEPLEFHCFGDLPGRAGLGSSSSFTVGCLNAVETLCNMNQHRGPVELAAEATYVEREVIKEAVGCQDQVFAAHGGLLWITFGGKRGVSVNPIVLPWERHEEFLGSLFLVFTGTMRDAHEMAARQIETVKVNEKRLSRLHRIAVEAHDALLGTIKIDYLGELLHESWMVKRELYAGVTSDPLDQLYGFGRACGATGGKLIGAGGGGFMLFWVPIDKQGKFCEAFQGRLLPFNVAERGSHVIVNDWS